MLNMNDEVVKSRQVRIALTKASRAIYEDLGEELWMYDDVVEVMGAIWKAWIRRGELMRAIDPDCYSVEQVKDENGVVNDA